MSAPSRAALLSLAFALAVGAQTTNFVTVATADSKIVWKTDNPAAVDSYIMTAWSGTNMVSAVTTKTNEVLCSVLFAGQPDGTYDVRGTTLGKNGLYSQASTNFVVPFMTRPGPPISFRIETKTTTTIQLQ